MASIMIDMSKVAQNMQIDPEKNIKSVFEEGRVKQV